MRGAYALLNGNAAINAAAGLITISGGRWVTSTLFDTAILPRSRGSVKLCYVTEPNAPCPTHFLKLHKGSECNGTC